MPSVDVGYQHKLYFLVLPPDPGKLIDEPFVVVMFRHCCCEVFADSSATAVYQRYYPLEVDWIMFRLMDVDTLGVVEHLDSLDNYYN